VVARLSLGPSCDLSLYETGTELVLFDVGVVVSRTLGRQESMSSASRSNRSPVHRQARTRASGSETIA
jgi:hypothetical protein